RCLGCKIPIPLGFVLDNTKYDRYLSILRTFVYPRVRDWGLVSGLLGRRPDLNIPEESDRGGSGHHHRSQPLERRRDGPLNPLAPPDKRPVGANRWSFWN